MRFDVQCLCKATSICRTGYGSKVGEPTCLMKGTAGALEHWHLGQKLKRPLTPNSRGALIEAVR